jgi:DNA-binding transcriptional LysR family regulator
MGTERLTGSIRVAASSSQMKNILLPSLKELLVQNPDILFEAQTYKPQQIAQGLRSQAITFALLDRPLQCPGIESVFFGEEQYVLIESVISNGSHTRFLIDESSEYLLERFLEKQTGFHFHGTRSYFGDSYSVIEGVALGLGHAIVPTYLIRKDHRVQKVPGCQPLITPLYLNYQKQESESSLHHQIMQALLRSNVTEVQTSLTFEVQTSPLSHEPLQARDSL